MTDEEDKSLSAAREALKRGRRRVGSDAKGASASGSGTGGKPAWKPTAGTGLFARIARIAAVADVFWNRWLGPVARFLNPFFSRVGRLYRWSYQRFAFVDDAGGGRVFSRNRAAMVIAVLGFVTVATPYFFFGTLIPALWRTTYDAVMLATMLEDHLFLGRAELIDPNRELYQVMGCRDITDCNGGDNTIYFRLRDNIILDIQHWTTRFEPYDPAEIAAAMVSELNDCTVTYYGRRSRALGWYPYIIRASCTPV
jgi:hypothetical protein